MEDETTSSIEMDAIAAHLDRGWDLLHRGDLAAARVSAHHILKLNSESAEAHTLLGAIAADEGDAEEAMELLRQAMALDPDYLEPILRAAELAVHALGDCELALSLCDEAEDLELERDEALDVLLLRVEALAAAGRGEEARAAATRIPAAPELVSSASLLRAGRALSDLDEPARAHPYLEAALAAPEPEIEAEAHYFLALSLEQQGRPREALPHFLRALDLERALSEPPYGSCPREEFERMIGEAIGALAPELAPRVSGVPVRVLDLPAMELVAEGFDPRASIYFSGVLAPAGDADPPRPSDTPPSAPPATAGKGGRRKGKAKQTAADESAAAGESAEAAFPTRGEPTLLCIFIYQRNVERAAQIASRIPQQLKADLELEATHFFALAPEPPAAPA